MTDRDLAYKILTWLERALLGPELYCTTCGTTGLPGRQVRRGPLVVEVLLWLLGAVLFWPLLLAALLYTGWRFASRRPRCRVCDGMALIPTTAPKAREPAVIAAIYARKSTDQEGA